MAARCRYGAFTRIDEVNGPLSVNHQGQFPVATISFNLSSSASLGEAVHDVNAAKQALGMPASLQGDFQGTARAFEASLVNEPLLILAAIVTVLPSAAGTNDPTKRSSRPASCGSVRS